MSQIVEALEFLYSEEQINEMKPYLEEKKDNERIPKRQIMIVAIGWVILEILMTIGLMLFFLLGWFILPQVTRNEYWNDYHAGNTNILTDLIDQYWILWGQGNSFIVLWIIFSSLLLFGPPLLKMSKINEKIKDLKYYLFLKNQGSYRQFTELEKKSYCKIQNYELSELKNFDFVSFILAPKYRKRNLFWFEEKITKENEFMKQFNSWFEKLLLEQNAKLLKLSDNKDN